MSYSVTHPSFQDVLIEGIIEVVRARVDLEISMYSLALDKGIRTWLERCPKEGNTYQQHVKQTATNPHYTKKLGKFGEPRGLDLPVGRTAVKNICPPHLLSALVLFICAYKHSSNA